MTNKEDISEVGSVELKAGDYVVRRGWYEVAVFLGNDTYGNYVIRYANQAKPIFVNTKYPELTFRFATQDETWRAGVKGNLPSLTTCPKGPHDWQPSAIGQKDGWTDVTDTTIKLDTGAELEKSYVLDTFSGGDFDPYE